MRATTFVIYFIYPIVSNMRIGESDDLPSIGGVCYDFLIAAKNGVEHYFTCSVFLAWGMSNLTTLKDCSIC
jgi:hypothetical protein